MKNHFQSITVLEEDPQWECVKFISAYSIAIEEGKPVPHLPDVITKFREQSKQNKAFFIQPDQLHEV
jgi:hypothetical protein